MKSTELWYFYFSVILTCFVLKLINKECLFNNHWNFWVISYLVLVLMDITSWIGSKNSIALHWRHNERGDDSNHRCLACLLNRLFRRESKKTSKLCVTGLCEGNPPVSGGFPSQRASNAENVSIWWRHHGISLKVMIIVQGADFIKSVNCGVSV